MSNLTYDPTRYAEATKVNGSHPHSIIQSEVGTRRRYEFMEQLLVRAGWNPSDPKMSGIVDIGCGYAGLYLYLKEKYSYWDDYSGIEGCELLYEQASKNVAGTPAEVIFTDARLIPPGSFKMAFGVMIGCLVDSKTMGQMYELLEKGFAQVTNALCFSSVTNIQPFRGDAGLLPSPHDALGMAYRLSNHFEIIAGEYVPQDVAGIIYK